MRRCWSRMGSSRRSGDAALRLAAWRKTQRLDYPGQVIAPGLIDSHVHLMWSGAGIEHGRDPMYAAIGQPAARLAVQRGRQPAGGAEPRRHHGARLRRPGGGDYPGGAGGARRPAGGAAGAHRRGAAHHHGRPLLVPGERGRGGDRGTPGGAGACTGREPTSSR